MNLHSHNALTKTVLRSLRLIWQADWRGAAAYLVVVLAQGLLPVATAWLAKLVLDRVGAAVTFSTGARSDLEHTAIAAAVWLVALQFVGRMLNPIAEQLEGNLIADVNAYVEGRMMAVGGAIPDLDHFERKAFHDEVRFLQSEVSWRPKGLLGWLHDLAIGLLTLAGSFALLWHLQPLLPVALILCALPPVVIYKRLQRNAYDAITVRSEAARVMAYCAEVMTETAAAKEVLSYGLGPWLWTRWQSLAQKALTDMARVRYNGLLVRVAVLAVSGVVLALAYAYVATQVGGHRLTIGDFALYLTVVAGLQQTLDNLTWGLGAIVSNAQFMARLFAFLDRTRPSIVVAPPEEALPVPAHFRQGLALRDVSFTYPGQDRPVLDGLTCAFGAGETVALVGANGAGKTTLVKLLCRLYDPTEGTITLDGVPIDRYDLASLRARTAVLFQDFAHFALSAQHNVGVGDVAFADGRERVVAAARWAGADGVIARLPKGLDTPLTKAFEGGVDLSGGEWLKVATARAAMRDAALVVLDEPTAALDAQAEAALFARFRELAQGRTVLLISHRFSTVRLADRIVVLEGGRIVEEGSHTALVAKGGRYAGLYELQAGRYR